MDDNEAVPPLIESSCDCECCCGGVMNRSFSGTYLRAVKRKYDECGARFVVPGLSVSQVARVEMANECVALREMVANQQLTIQDMGVELEEERNASSSAANEAMSMILRLQREKAEIQMEARQFKRFAEEKMAHDGQGILVLEDLLYKREQTIQSLTCEVQAYKHRMMSYGLSEDEADGGKVGGAMSRNNSSVGNLDQPYNEIPTYDYPPLKCNLNDTQPPYEVQHDAVDVDKYAFGETPPSLDHLKDLENRINLLEQSPRHSQPDVDFFGTKKVLEKVIVGHSPRRYSHFRRFSTDSSFSNFPTVKEKDSVVVAADSPKIDSAKNMDCIHSDEFSNLKKVDNSSEVGNDMSDRVYTIDSVHNGVSYNGGMEPKANIGICEDYMSTPRESLNIVDAGDAEIKNLYKRLQALEADKESMRQALISMRTDNAQLVLLKEIAQQLCGEVSPNNKMLPVRKTSGVSCSLTSVVKWVTSFVFWRKKSRRSKHMSGMSPDNVGLLMLLDKGPRLGHWRCLSSTQV